MGDPGPANSPGPPSNDGERRGEGALAARLIGLFLVGCVGFAGPLLRIASQHPLSAVWPTPFLFLYGFWFLLIVLLAMALRARAGE